LRAGLWPRLTRDDHHFLPLPVIRPERAALTGSNGLAASLNAALRQYKIKKTRAQIGHLLDDTEAFRHLLAELQACASARLGSEGTPPTIVIPIDQGEELFTAERKDRAEAEQVLSLLAKTLTTQDGDGSTAGDTHLHTLAIVAIRSDAYDRLQTEPRLQAVKQAPFDLKPMSRQEFKAVIEGPAARSTAAGLPLSIEAALTEQLLHDAEGADALPLLGFILERLYVEHGADGDLKLTEYESLGGIEGSIEAAVQAAFADPDRRPVIPTEEVKRNRLLHDAFIPWLAGVDPEMEKAKRRVAQWKDLPSDPGCQ
jgi:hypothetical protein